MAITEQRILKSIEFLLSSQHVQICWEDQILKDGEIVNASVHRGAYPVDANGDIDESLGLSLSSLLGEAGAAAQKNLQDALTANLALRGNIELLNGIVSAEAEYKSQLLVRIEGLNNVISTGAEEKNNLQKEIEMLREQLASFTQNDAGGVS